MSEAQELEGLRFRTSTLLAVLRRKAAELVAVRSNLSTGSKTSRQDSHCCFKESGRSKSRKRGNYDRRRTSRESPLAFGAVATGARHRAKTARTRPWLAAGVSRSTWYRRKAAGAAGGRLWPVHVPPSTAPRPSRRLWPATLPGVRRLSARP